MAPNNSVGGNNYTGSSGNEVTVTLAGTPADDTVVLFGGLDWAEQDPDPGITGSSGVSLTAQTPTTWTHTTSTNNAVFSAVYAGLATASDPSATYHSGSGRDATAAAIAYALPGEWTVVDAASTGADETNTGTTGTAPSLNGAEPGDILICAWQSLYTQTAAWSVPGSMAGQVNAIEPQGEGGAMTAAYEEITSSGSTGTRSATQGAAVVWSASSILLRPVDTTLAVTPDPIPSAEVIGEPTLSTGPVGVAPDSIASAETVPEPTVTPGAVTVTPDSIPSAEAVGEPKIDAGVRPDPILSAEVVGEPRITMSKTVPDSILSAEAVGEPTITTGPVTVAPDTITSEETVPEATVTPGPVTITPDSIPSAESIGEPTLTTGPVTITPNSIPSAERVGQPRLLITASELARGTFRRVSLGPTYQLAVVSRIPSATGAPAFFEVDRLVWTKLSYSSALNEPQELSATCLVSALTPPIRQRLRDLANQPTELQLLRNGRVVFAGPLVGGQRNGEEITLAAAGLLAYLRRMTILESYVQEQIDQFTVVKDLVDAWQALSYGHYGLDTSGIGTSGVLRDVDFPLEERQKLLRYVTELGAQENGFDVRVTPEARRLELHHPRLGLDRSSGEDAVIFDHRNIAKEDVMFSAGPDDIATEAFGTSSASGDNEALLATASNEELRAKFGRSAAVGSFSDIGEQAALDERTAAMLEARSGMLVTPGSKVSVTPDSDLSQYDEGDTVRFVVDSLIGIDGPFRLRKVTVNVSKQASREQVDLEFV